MILVAPAPMILVAPAPMILVAGGSATRNRLIARLAPRLAAC